MLNNYLEFINYVKDFNIDKIEEVEFGDKANVRMFLYLNDKEKLKVLFLEPQKFKSIDEMLTEFETIRKKEL